MGGTAISLPRHVRDGLKEVEGLDPLEKHHDFLGKLDLLRSWILIAAVLFSSCATGARLLLRDFVCLSPVRGNNFMSA
jgi:hypothetical protein